MSRTAASRAALLIATVLAGCGDGDTVECWVEPSFSDQQRTELYHAAEAWNHTANRYISLEGNPDTECKIMLRDEEHIPYRPLEPDGRIEIVDGLARKSKYVYLRRGIDVSRFPLVALHEMGHLIGVQHLPEGKFGVMGPHTRDDGVAELTSDDIAQCRYDKACD